MYSTRAALKVFSWQGHVRCAKLYANSASPFKANAETTFLCTLPGHPPQLRLPLGPSQVHNLPGIASQFELRRSNRSRENLNSLWSLIEVLSFHIAQGLLAAIPAPRQACPFKRHVAARSRGGTSQLRRACRLQDRAVAASAAQRRCSTARGAKRISPPWTARPARQRCRRWRSLARRTPRARPFSGTGPKRYGVLGTAAAFHAFPTAASAGL